MIDILHFVRGAVSAGDSVLPVLTHFCIYDGRIQGANGRISIDAPCTDLKFNAITPAEKFLKAIDSCDGDPDLRLTDKGKLIVKQGGFRAVLSSQPIDAFPRAKPSGGQRQVVGPKLLEVLRLLRPFISTDAERAWASTIYFSVEEETAYATTNAMIGMSKAVPFNNDVQLPVFCVDELLRIGREPIEWSEDENSITFWWTDDFWMRTQKIAAEWPTETAKKLAAMKTKMIEIPKHILIELERLIPFCPNAKYPVIMFKGSTLATLSGDSEATVELDVDLGEGAFHAENLKPMLACSTHMGITDKMALFKGEDFRGVMTLLRI